ncbi:MAG: peptide deformylase [Synechococcaceae cyanobacterium]|jgi:peptide deformylase
MPVRPVLLRGDPRLRQPAQPVPTEQLGLERLLGLVRDLLDTQTARSGAGLAAPQIGEPWRVVVVGSGAFNPRYPLAPVIPRQVLVNPRCTPLEPATDLAEEGCLSVPDLRAPVRRWRRVLCEAITPEGQTLSQVMEGFAARVLQHEIDHLDGVLFPDRLTDGIALMALQPPAKGVDLPTMPEEAQCKPSG